MRSAGGAWPGYTPRSVKETVLYRTVAEHYPVFLERTGEVGTLPAFVRREFESFLKCGVMEDGGKMVIRRFVTTPDDIANELGLGRNAHPQRAPPPIASPQLPLPMFG